MSNNKEIICKLIKAKNRRPTATQTKLATMLPTAMATWTAQLWH